MDRAVLKRLVTIMSLCLALAGAVQATEDMHLIDVHVHYNADYMNRYPPARIIAMLGENNIDRAVVTSYPPEQVMSLYMSDPDRFIPMLGVYQTREDKHTWMHDDRLPAKIKQMLSQGQWRGVGELHVFADQRRSEVLLKIVAIAAGHDLPLLLHCDPAVIDSVFEHSPDVRVIWAHAGAYPFPQLLRDYLARYPRLYIDLSVRDERIAPDGELDPEWESLLWEYPERFMVGVDTYSVERWQRYGVVATRIRNWLSQLPQDIASGLAYDNAANVFKLTR
jgi:predicted TIM-barrel fold metal-dependent hydrolase